MLMINWLKVSVGVTDDNLLFSQEEEEISFVPEHLHKYLLMEGR